jgi:hypothetical protein
LFASSLQWLVPLKNLLDAPFSRGKTASGASNAVNGARVRPRGPRRRSIYATTLKIHTPELSRRPPAPFARPPKTRKTAPGPQEWTLETRLCPLTCCLRSVDTRTPSLRRTSSLKATMEASGASLDFGNFEFLQLFSVPYFI